MGSLWILAGLIGGAMLILVMAWPKIRGLVPASVQTVGDRIDTAVDKSAASAALETLVLLFNERADTATVAVLGELWVKIWAWQPPTTPVVIIPPVVSPLDQLAAKVALLEAAQKTTSTIPAASIAGA